MEIEKEIVQAKFKSPLQKGIVNIIYTSNWIHSRQAKVLKPFGITIQQYNILRILRGQHPNPASITLLTDRMLDKMSNASRLVEKLLAKGYVERTVCPSDRRQVNVLITPVGLAILPQLENVLDQVEGNVHNLSDDELEMLSSLLDRLRG
ncbi:MAG: MarR family transcriptional regulator [Bacteroidetes bacterium]|nr:MarR family transcriptional regulator [Bacteroidota bacterium]MBL0017531.1 MarR family transcriptional regulator [Bacteroidota bacterium]MBP6640639.1 MarR family transcriptional regulator [Bacteroidia bacterium]MBP6722532.1 MarR family transcriptional regulator [Bacteroidia bacterium]MBP8074245.1 MarR family transcriptional regulator [Bacteroidia bacterium]